MKYYFGGLLTVVCVFLLISQQLKEITPKQTESNSDNTNWVWENPVTFKKISIPSAWQKAEGAGTEETLLTLAHQTGKSLINIINEETLEDISLADYVEALQDSNQQELGTSEFETIETIDGVQLYLSEGSRYINEKIVGSRVSIWSYEPNNFWRSMMMTNLEYKELEFESKKLVKMLEDSSK